MQRRSFLRVGGRLLAGLSLAPRIRLLQPEVVEIRMRSDARGSEVWFDPLGVHVEPGQTIRWVVEQNVHTATAYHPRNDNHQLRIPPDVEPWDSGFLVNPGDHYELTLRREGVYDYFCRPHEVAGMVGRLVVGRPPPPAPPVFDPTRRAIPVPALEAFPALEEILTRGRVRRRS